MGETRRTSELCKALFQRRGMDSFPLMAGPHHDQYGGLKGASPPGWPDRIVSHKICALCLVEFKDYTTPTTSLQLRRIKELQRACICRFQQASHDDAPSGLPFVRLEGVDSITEWFDSLRLPEMLEVFFAKGV